MRRWAQPAGLWVWVATIATFALAAASAAFLLNLGITIIGSLFTGGLIETVTPALSALALLASLVIAYWASQLVYRALRGRTEANGAETCGGCGYDLTGNVSDRCPECGMDNVRYVASHLKRREKLLRLKVVAMVVCGAPFSLLGPFVLATMFWIALQQLGIRTEGYWSALFLLLAVVTVPLLYRLEMRAGGDYLSTLLRETPVYPTRGAVVMASTYSTVYALGGIAANPRATSSLFVEVFIFGPRLVLGGLHQTRLARSVGLSDSMRAAGVVATLLRGERGMETRQFLRENETFVDVMPCLAYLAFYQWIGVGEEWQRVWLRSDARRILTNG